jgi:hypothetical protein
LHGLLTEGIAVGEIVGLGSVEMGVFFVGGIVGVGVGVGLCGSIVGVGDWGGGMIVGAGDELQYCNVGEFGKI